MIGNSLGPYKIVEKLGAGGMGEVYLAEDTRLDRKVAIKVLPAEFASDPERLARFEQEAKAAAALNHPHIAVVHDIGFEPGAGPAPEQGAAVSTGDGVPSGAEAASAGVRFIVQEYLEGEPLRRALDQAALPLKKMLALAAEIGEALGAAHAAGIVHRDLKPENIFITKDGHAKVLDFGLAKLTEVAPTAGGSASRSPTMLGTAAGQVMGTAGYMSPEQVNGEPVDRRADLFAFGCVLYEMASGKRAFSGKNLPETLHLLSNTDPVPVTETIPTLPLQLGWIVDKALAKEPAERYQAAAEMVIDLRRLAGEVEAGKAVPARDSLPTATSRGAAIASTGRFAAIARVVPWFIALAATVIAAWAWTASGPSGARNTPMFLPLEQLPLDTEDGMSRLAISPDGIRIAVVIDDELQIIDLAQGGAPLTIRGSGFAQSPVFSPDGERIAYVADGELRTVRLRGGLPTVLASGLSPQIYGLDWSDDGRLIYVPDWGADVYAVPADGGEQVSIASPDAARGEQGFGWASLLPDGEHLLYSMWDTQWNIAVRSLVGGDPRILIENGHDARYVPTGHLVFAQDQQLVAAPFDLEALEVGEPGIVIDNMFAHFPSGLGGYTLSDEGTLVYLEGSADVARELWRVDSDGVRTLLSERRGRFDEIAMSPDGQQLVLSIIDPREGKNLWLLDVSRDTLSPLTSGQSWMTEPRFSRDGQRVLYASEVTGAAGFRARALDGSDTDERLSPTGVIVWEHTWHPDGTVAYVVSMQTSDGSADIWTLAPGAAAPELLLGGPDFEGWPEFSPDGSALAFVSSRTGRNEVWLIPYPRQATTAPWQVTTDGGHDPRWSSDGRTLWFRTDDGEVWSVQVDEDLRTTEPVRRFQNVDEQWAIAGDGSYVVTLNRLEPPRLRMIINWFFDLRARVSNGR